MTVSLLPRTLVRRTPAELLRRTRRERTVVFAFLSDFNAGCGATPGLQRNKTSSAWLHDEGDDVVSYTADDEDW